MTLPASGTISISDIDAEFARGKNLNAYRGTPYWLEGNATEFAFPTGQISMSDFYSKRATRPVTGGTQSFTANGTFTVPIYNTLTVTCHGAKGADAADTSGCGGGTGGTGGKAVKTYTYGAAGAPVAGAGIAISVGTNSIFGAATQVRGNVGGGAISGVWVPPTESLPGFCSTTGTNGANGTASGGDTNTTGGSTYPSGRIDIEWS